MAIQYLKEGGYTWNSGMFMWSVQTIVNEICCHAPQIASIMDRISPALFEENEQEVVNELFPQCEKVSIDYAVMEKTHNAFVQPAEFGWSDLGTWGSLHTLSPHDDSDNVIIGENVTLIESSGCMVRVPREKRVVIQGIKDCIVAEHDNTLLICQLKDEQRIKDWHD